VTLNALRVRARKRHEAVPTGPNESLTPASAT
jgi:hypothetical protein